MFTAVNVKKRFLQLGGMMAARQDVAMAVVLLVAVLMMILPLPVFMVDILISINIAFSVILLLMVIYINDPLELSVFPSLILLTTLYRLALTISTSRLVLLQHDAGHIVEAFGHFVVGGNLTVGLVIFTIITIVQFLVITRGAERVAEVSARFSLDGMPGKQMSIDGDLRAEIIDAGQAREQRQAVQKESRMLGAMDGAMKFVKGDAIAGIIVVLVNILGGIVIAVMQYGMPLNEAVSTYSVLSVGDGLCAQIPSLLISLSAGFIVTRVPGEQRANLATEVTTQLGKQPHALLLTAGVLLLLSVIPGFPFLDFFVLGGVTAIPFMLLRQRRRQGGGTDPSPYSGADGMMQPGAAPLILRLSSSLHSPSLQQDVDVMRWRLFEHSGVPLPEIRIEVCADVPQGTLCVLMYMEPVFECRVPADMCLVDGKDAQEQGEVLCLPDGMGQVGWLPASAVNALKDNGIPVATGEQRIVMLLQRVLTRHMPEFIGVQEARYLMDCMEKQYAELVKELQRQLPVSKVTETLQRLVAESVSIRDLRTIFGTLIEWAPREKDTLMLTEYVRMSLRRHLLHRLSPAGYPVQALRIGEELENLIRESVRISNMGSYSVLEPRYAEHILSLTEQALGRHPEACIVTSLDVRRFVRKFIENRFFNTAVVSWQELGDACQVSVVENLDISPQELAEHDEYPEY